MGGQYNPRDRIRCPFRTLGFVYGRWGLSKRSILPYRAFVLLLSVVLLAACASATSPKGIVRVAPGLDLVMPQPRDLGRSLEATQLVSARFGDQTTVFEGHVSVTPERLLLVVLDPLGRKALSVTWNGAAVVSEKADWLPQALRPENMLADIILLYWPEAAVSRALAPSGGTLVGAPGSRSIFVAGQEVIHADYLSAAEGAAWAGHAHYRNLPWGYDLDIQSAIAAP
ncbi:MAG: hypothetical protein QOJ54_2324 [Aliidongia sp.]|nr:hypothetical protein [Aliidongia sp.]